VLAADEVARDHEAWQAVIAARESPDLLDVTARVTARSTPPTPEKIKPYTQALIMVEYEVQQVHAGQEQAKRLRIAQWAILDGKPVGLPNVGDVRRLRLTPLKANAQIQADVLEDTLDLDLDAPEYHCNEVHR